MSANADCSCEPFWAAMEEQLKPLEVPAIMKCSCKSVNHLHDIADDAELVKVAATALRVNVLQAQTGWRQHTAIVMATGGRCTTRLETPTSFHETCTLLM